MVVRLGWLVATGRVAQVVAELAAQRPPTLAQASRIPGVSPADLQNLLLILERRRRERAETA